MNDHALYAIALAALPLIPVFRRNRRWRTSLAVAYVILTLLACFAFEPLAREVAASAANGKMRLSENDEMILLYRLLSPLRWYFLASTIGLAQLGLRGT